jgi:hypothetical protein
MREDEGLRKGSREGFVEFAGSDRGAKTVGGDTGGAIGWVSEVKEVMRNRVTVGVEEGVIAEVGDGAESLT